RQESRGASSFQAFRHAGAGHKRRRHPEGCRHASFHGTRSNPCPFDLGAPVAQRLPMKVHGGHSRIHAMAMKRFAKP
ncbi:MAG TPA: hypothetical protein VN043_14640, partial [Rhodanobacter sp.]|nr:hypothetical protein [Rhodanobacter sp.]